MPSYKMKNYALLNTSGKLTIMDRVCSRGLERFQRQFLRDLILLLLTDQEDRFGLYERSPDLSVMSFRLKTSARPNALGISCELPEK